MRRAMARAEVGDDGFGEDATTAKLEERYASLVGKEAAMLCPSGVMANQVAMRVLARPGDRLVAGRLQHLVAFEYGATAMNAGLQLELLDDAGGALRPAEVAAVVASVEHYQPEVGAVAVENTHMASGGRTTGRAELEAVVAAAGGRPVHLDGARLLNAAIARGEHPAELAGPATTVMTCLSKGLSAPFGSLLAGPASLMEHARLERKRLGGALRQSGVLAAAGLVALESMVERLARDHERAAGLAEAVEARWPGSTIGPVETNIVAFRHGDPPALLDHLAAHGVLADTIGPGIVRLVTHRHVKDRHVAKASAAIAVAP